ncbi:MAG: XdhC family protein [Pseudomonadota bacterium]
MDRDRVFAFLAARQSEGRACVLVTVMAVEGSSIRNPGTHMGVCEDGRFVGSLSGGCIENAVVSEALVALREGAGRVVRFGAGSRFIDITLPCGGGIDVHFQPLDGSDFVDQCSAAIAARRPFTVQISTDGIACVSGWQPLEANIEAGTGRFGHWPQPRLTIVGHGASVEALAKLARAMEIRSDILTPDEAMRERLAADEFTVQRLERTSDTHLLTGDAWTAFVFLFHDHDWEVQLLARALALPHFYCGAMGSRKAHAARNEALVAAGVSAEAIASINAPIGLFHSSRDPETLALSTMSEIVSVYQATDFERDLG